MLLKCLVSFEAAELLIPHLAQVPDALVASPFLDSGKRNWKHVASRASDLGLFLLPGFVVELTASLPAMDFAMAVPHRAYTT